MELRSVRHDWVTFTFPFKWHNRQHCFINLLRIKYLCLLVRRRKGREELAISAIILCVALYLLPFTTNFHQDSSLCSEKILDHLSQVLSYSNSTLYRYLFFYWQWYQVLFCSFSPLLLLIWWDFWGSNYNLVLSVWIACHKMSYSTVGYLCKMNRTSEWLPQVLRLRSTFSCKGTPIHSCGIVYLFLYLNIGDYCNVLESMSS